MVRARVEKPAPRSSQLKTIIAPVVAPSSSSSPHTRQEIGNQAMPTSTSNLLAGNISFAPTSRNRASPIQAKLTIGQPGDKYEQEADRVAAQVVNQIQAPVTQPQALPESKELQKKPKLQLKASASQMTAAPDLETNINQARSGGQPMAQSIKEPMEQSFGADFSGVKVHTDERSNQLNQSIQARAFTTGQDVFFRQGEYNPGSRGGQELLAHELTHVVQQGGGAVQRAGLVQRFEEVEAAQQVSDMGIKKDNRIVPMKPEENLLQRAPASDFLPGNTKFSKKPPFIKKDGGDQIEEIEVNGEDWKKYMELEQLRWEVEDLQTDTQFGHYIQITIQWYNKSNKVLRLMTQPPLVYFEEITRTETTNGNTNTETESVDQYAENPGSNTFMGYRWQTKDKTIDPGQKLKVKFIDPPQITKTSEYKSREVKFKIGLKGSQQWLTGVQRLICENNQIIEHEFTK